MFLQQLPKRLALIALSLYSLGFCANTMAETIKLSNSAPAEGSAPTVAHLDPLTVDPGLSLAKVISLTMDKFPDMLWLDALEQEVSALRGKGESLLAGAANASLAFQEATSGTLHYIDAAVEVPLWNSGQRTAQQRVTNTAAQNALSQEDALKFRIAGLVRQALWDIALADMYYQQALVESKMTETLLEKVQRRVALEDLPHTDFLLAQTELLQKRSALTQAEAELMHARKRYTTITQLKIIPANYQEQLVALKEIRDNHPALVALNTQIERKQAELHAVKLVGSGQTALSVGINSDDSSDPRSNQTQSFNIGVVVPFGGSAHLAPHIAEAQVALAKLFAERDQLLRDLDQAHHEAEHNLEVNAAQMKTAEDLRVVAEEHLKLSQLGFAEGEIDLIDLLKIQVRTQQAILNAKQRTVMQQRDIALYNQAVGVMP